MLERSERAELAGEVRRRLDGLMSRCVIPEAWRWARAAKSWWARRATKALRARVRMPSAVLLLLPSPCASCTSQSASVEG